MCGIAGVLSPASGMATAAVESMLGTMANRGPDGTGLWQGDGIVLGHRRLAIVDLSDSGRQPMVLPDGSLAATVNGEIYNYPSLRAELEALGAQFASNCDSEVVLHAYRAWGIGAIERFNGMFGFALWDADRRELYVARDRMGIKPVYYRREETGALSFASDIKALVLAAGRREWAIDAEGLAQYLALQNYVGDQTLLAGIRAVRPGHYLKVSGDADEQVAYWRPTYNRRSPAGVEEAATQARRTIEAAVERHLMSDVPPASYLSAGMDSTVVAALAARHAGEALATFTGAFEEGGWYDERSGARLVAAKIGSPLDEVVIGSESFRTNFDAMAFSLDEPRMGLGAFSQYMVAKRAAATRKMILTGHGGDELFSGYPVFKLALLRRLFRDAPSRALRLLFSVKPSELPHLVYFALRGSRKPPLPRLFDAVLRRRALRPEVEAGLLGREPVVAADEERNAYDRVLRTYLEVYLPGLLTVEDKVSMAHALESRTPLLDNEVVRFALELGEETKLAGGELKTIMRRVARDLLPPALFAMPKRGFPTPLNRWLRTDLAGWMGERIAGPGTVLTRLFRRDYLEQTVRGYVRSWRRHVRPLDEIQTHRVWMLLNLESWMRQYEALGVRIVAPTTDLTAA